MKFCLIVSDEVLETLHDAEVIVTDPILLFPHFIDKLPNLKWMQATWAGKDGYTW